MARVKGGMSARRKHNKVLKLAKGYRGARSKQYRVAKQSVMRALTSSYAGRKERKRQFRAVDRSYQCSCKTERLILFQIYVRLKAGWRRYEQKDAGRDGSKRCGRFCYPG